MILALTVLPLKGLPVAGGVVGEVERVLYSITLLVPEQPQVPVPLPEACIQGLYVMQLPVRNELETN